MAHRTENLYRDLRAWAERHGVAVRERPLDAETPGTFDGPSVTMNSGYDPQQRCWYFAHALGSIVRWALDPAHCQGVFDELDAAKRSKASDPARLGRALAAYRAYESDASEYAVWLLAACGYADLMSAYTNFARADLEAMTLRHRDGACPPWPEFFARWNREVAAGSRTVEPYRPRPVPPFAPVRMRPQEIVQERDGDPDD